MRGRVIDQARQAKKMTDEQFFEWLTTNYSTASEMARAIEGLSGQIVSIGAVTTALKRRQYNPTVITQVKWQRENN